MTARDVLTVLPGGKPGLPDRDRTAPLRAAEFFAGIGLVRLGLEEAGFQVCWSNDYSADKKAMYRAHFRDPAGVHTFEFGDVASVTGDQIPDGLALAWASFPCTDLSLAGDREGLRSGESKTFWDFTRILAEMGRRRPRVITLENVTGLATSHGGDDLAAAVRELNSLGYSIDVLTLDARRFVPQSRARLFLIGALDPPEDAHEPDGELRPDWLQAVYGDPTLRTHQAALPSPPPPLTAGLGALIEPLADADDRWWDADRCARFLASLSDLQAERLATLRGRPEVAYRTAYRRTRHKVAVWEIRSDDVSGCLRTARGGSSKQAVVEAGRGRVRVRWMTPREYAALMGAPGFALEGARANQALYGFGDAVCVPVVAWLATNYLLPLTTGAMGPARAAALLS